MLYIERIAVIIDTAPNKWFTFLNKSSEDAVSRVWLDNFLKI